MKAYLEIVNLNNDVVTGSDPVPAECCDWGCYTDGEQTSPDNHDE